MKRPTLLRSRIGALMIDAVLIVLVFRAICTVLLRLADKALVAAAVDPSHLIVDTAGLTLLAVSGVATAAVVVLLAGKSGETPGERLVGLRVSGGSTVR